MNVYFITSGYDGCNYVRMMLPAFHNGFRLNKASLTSKIDNPKKMNEMLEMADVVAFHRPETKEYYELAKLLKDNGKKIVVDNDDTFKLDDYYKLAEFSPDAVGLRLKDRDGAMDKMLGLADMVTTSTEFLAEEYRKMNDNVVVLPNSVDEMDWDEPLRNEGKKVRIGMVGSVAYEYDYLHIKDLLRGLSDRDDVQLVLFGLGSKKHREEQPKVTEAFSEEYEFWDSLDIDHVEWKPMNEYQKTLNKARLDMMLIPRKDNYFNRCKSNLKFLEAAMCEIPCICQSFKDGPYEEITHLVNGVKIFDNDNWIHLINYLVENKDRRREIGRLAKKYVLNNYNIECSASMWENAYKKLWKLNQKN